MMRGYLRHPGSLLLRLLCVLSAVITGGRFAAGGGLCAVQGDSVPEALHVFVFFLNSSGFVPWCS